METNERQIRELGRKVEASEAVISRYYEDAGEAAFAGGEDRKGSVAAELLNRAAAIDIEVENEHKRISDILSAVERTDEIDALRKNLKEKIRSIEKDNMSNYETIGRASFEAYKEGELPQDKYSEVFTEIVKLRLRIDEYESELKRLDAAVGSRKLMEKFRDGTRRLYLKNSMAGSYKTLQRQYKKAGEKICHSELVMNLEAESVENALKPFRVNMKGIEKLEKEHEKLSSENEKLRGNLEGLGAGRECR